MAGEETTVRWADAGADVEAAIAVRVQVFCREQGVSREDEFDGRDEQASHVLAVELDGGRVVGTLRLLIDGEEAKIGRVAVEADRRRRGLASRMLELALAGARERGATRVRLAAQLQARELYARAGFAEESDLFEEAGIPHVWMGMRLG